MDKTNKKLLRDALIWAMCAALILPGLSTKLAVRTYTVTGGLSAPVRLCLITDLHSCRYGEREAELIAAIEAAEPDVILLGGDICDDEIPDDNTEYLLQGIAERWPSLSVTGNHEYWGGARSGSSSTARCWSGTACASCPGRRSTSPSAGRSWWFPGWTTRSRAW